MLESQAGIKIDNRNINNLIYADDTTVMSKSKEKLKSLLMKMKEESEKSGFKLNIKTKIMASSPITSCWIDGEKVESLTDYIFLGSKSLSTVTAAMKLKKLLVLWREESYDKPRQHIKKQRHHIADKGLFSQSSIWFFQ